MRLIRLVLRNFKGIRDFTLEPRGGNISIWGDNATGKTTLADAFMWLMFDKDSSNRKDFEIKTLDPATGEAIHGLEHEVEAVLDLEPGELVLRKLFKEKWTKKRGSAHQEFTGHTTDYFVDGVPVQRGEYVARVAAIADEAAFRLVTDPGYFNEQLHWQDRRRILLQVCGDVTDAEVIASDPALAPLPDILGRRSLDDHRKVLTARRREINQELERIPVRIDEATRALPEAAGDPAALQAALAGARQERTDREAARVRVQTGGQVAQLQRRIAELDAQMMAITQSTRAEADAAVQQERPRLVAVHDQIDARRREIRSLEAEAEARDREAGRLEPQIEALRRRWHLIDAEQLTDTTQDACPACGQALPTERVEEARGKALAEFNAAKSRRLEEITSEGQLLAGVLKTTREAAAQNRQAAETRQAALAALESEASDIQARIDRLRREAPDVAAVPEYAAAALEKREIEASIAALRTGSAEALAQVAEEIRALDARIAGIEGDLQRIDQRERGQQRIQRLRGEERKLAAEFERLEREMYLTEQFIRSKVKLLEERINSRFRHARFRLFEVQVNGGVSECCETLYGGVPYSTALNNGARINVGLDIINTLSEHYRFEAPIWIDNRESVTQLIPTRAQVISLVVSEPDKTLRVELDPTREYAREAV